MIYFHNYMHVANSWEEHQCRMILTQNSLVNNIYNIYKFYEVLFNQVNVQQLF